MNSLGPRAAVILLGAALSATSPACSSGPDCSSPDELCVGLVTSTAGIVDHGLNELTWSALGSALREGTIQHARFIETVDSRDYEKNIAYFAANSYDVIVTVGGGQALETGVAAAEFPDTQFVGLDQSPESPPPNLVTVTFPYDQMGFAAGWLAAQLTESGTVGAVCESSELEAMRLYCEGFDHGAASVRPDLQILVRYGEGQAEARLFADPAWGARTAGGLIAQGADVMFAAGGDTAQGALQAAADFGAYAIGAERDQWQAVPRLRPALLTSFYPSPEMPLLELLSAIRTGRPPGNNLMGAFAVAPFRDVDEAVSEQLRAGLAELSFSLKSGQLGTGVQTSRRK